MQKDSSKPYLVKELCTADLPNPLGETTNLLAKQVKNNMKCPWVYEKLKRITNDIGNSMRGIMNYPEKNIKMPIQQRDSSKFDEFSPFFGSFLYSIELGNIIAQQYRDKYNSEPDKTGQCMLPNETGVLVLKENLMQYRIADFEEWIDDAIVKYIKSPPLKNFPRS